MKGESNELSSIVKKRYNSEFLRSLQCHPLSLKKPDLPDLDIVQQVPLPNRPKPEPKDGVNVSFTGARKKNKLNTKSQPKSIPSPNDVLYSSNLVPSPPIARTISKPINLPKSEKVNEKKKSLVPLSNIDENSSTKAQTIQDIEYLLGRKFTAPQMNNDDAKVQERCLLFFDKDDVKKLVDKEIDNHYKKKDHSLAYQVHALTGNLKETIIEASRHDKLNDWLVAMSASISREFWSKIALLYAKQLEKSDEFTQAAFYYLSVHYIDDAVEVLVKGGLFKESLILAKSCVPFDTKLIQSILNAWAKSKESQEDWEFAAKIYVSNLESKEAARCLSQRKDDSKCESLIKILDSVTALRASHDCI